MFYGSLVAANEPPKRTDFKSGTAVGALGLAQRFFRLEKLGVTEKDVAAYAAQDCEARDAASH